MLGNIEDPWAFQSRSCYAMCTGCCCFCLQRYVLPYSQGFESHKGDLHGRWRSSCAWPTGPRTRAWPRRCARRSARRTSRRISFLTARGASSARGAASCAAASTTLTSARCSPSRRAACGTLPRDHCNAEQEISTCSLHALAVEPVGAWQRRPTHRRYCKCYLNNWPSCRTQSTTVLCCVQGQQVLTDGIGRGTEEEEDLDPKAARQFLTEPSRLLELESPLVQKVRRRAARFFTCPCHMQ